MDYGRDVLSGGGPSDPRFVDRRVRTIEAEPDLVVEDAVDGFCGAVISCSSTDVTLEDRHGNSRIFPLEPARFLLEGRTVTLVRPSAPVAPATRRVTASGSIAVDGARARTARAARIYVEGIHDAALVERVWGEDLRLEGIVVEPLHGVDDLPGVVRQFAPRSHRRLGVLVDHLVPGSKESRIVAGVDSPFVLVTGHPYVDIWEAVKPEAIGIAGWPQVPKGQPWKEGVCQALGVSDPQTMWRRVLGSVNRYTDLQTPLLGAVEHLIDFVTQP